MPPPDTDGEARGGVRAKMRGAMLDVLNCWTLSATLPYSECASRRTFEVNVTVTRPTFALDIRQPLALGEHRVPVS